MTARGCDPHADKTPLRMTAFFTLITRHHLSRIKNKKGERTMNKKREFVDNKKHSGMHMLYDLKENYNEQNTEYTIKQLKLLIEQDPDYLDPYIMLYEIFQEEGNYFESIIILDSAYERALHLITDKKGNWPDVLEWGWLENRHIIRTLLNKALYFWMENQTPDALNLLRKLLRTNPGDNIGARNYILAIRMGMSYDEFENLFDIGGFYDAKMFRWFEENYKNFPDEFDWWEKAIEEIE